MKLLLILLLLAPNAYAKKIIVAVIDTGFAYTAESLAEDHLCKYGHKDFTADQRFAKYLDTKDKVPLDTNRHGTMMVGIINKFAEKANYCIVVIKFFSDKSQGIENNFSSRLAIQYAINLKVDVINYSGGSTEPDSWESVSIKKFLDKKGIFVAAAGNEGKILGMEENYYPAMYDPRIHAVGNLDKNGKRAISSNWGDLVTDWEIGTEVKAFGMTGTGTSQACATKTGKIVKNLRK